MVITKLFKIQFFLLILFVGINQYGKGQVSIDFNSEQFQVVNGKVVEHLDRTAFMGTGYINDVEFENGIIEFDLAVTGQRSYPGIFFRATSPNNYEHFYVRPHRSGLYPDALQYCPTTSGIGSWQLFNGTGYTAATEKFPVNEWFHIRIEIKDTRAQVLINNNINPGLEIFELYHGLSKGSISLNCPANGSAYFSNLTYQITDDITFGEMPVFDTPIGLITDWEISQPFRTVDNRLDQTPKMQGIENMNWQAVKADRTGLVDIAKYQSRQGRAPDFVFAKTNIVSQKDSLLEMKFGYSDAIVIFLNDKPIYYGNSAYTQRDPSFLGIIGLNDAVFLPLKEGNNELMLSVAESFGGWGFKCQEGSKVLLEEGITKKWETDKVFAVSESVLYDPKREVLYVTNFDQLSMGNPNITQSISKISLDGKIIDQNFAEGLNHPLGMSIYEDKIYVAERRNVAIINLETGEIENSINVEGSVFLNDLAIGAKGEIYISDSRKNVIWKIDNGEVGEWLTGEDVTDPNVLYYYDSKLLFGNSGDSWLKSVDPETKSITYLAKFPEGFIDGLRPDGNGNLYVSLWKGKIYQLDPDGHIKLILHTENLGEYTADFEFIPEKKMFIIPTFYENRVSAYQID